MYKPWTFGINSFVQGFLFGFIELTYQYIYKFSPEREIFELSDGGHIALDFFYTDKRPNKKKKDYTKRESPYRPLVVIVPGLTGDHTRLYMISTIKAGLENGYDCVVVNYRGLAGVPLKVSFGNLNTL